MGEGGAKRIVIVLAIAAVAAIGVFWYWQHAKQRALGSGKVYVKNQGADQSQPASNPAKPNIASSQPEAPALPPATAAGPAASSAKPSAAIEKIASSPQPAHSAPPAMTQPRGAIEIPASDTIPRNPPNGLIFAGVGKYQLYRQGDITWRLDTNTGRSCIIFATDMQWAKLRVWDSGCGAS